MPRNRKGQSMVEYALGLGCVAALCMVALGALGHINGHIIHNIVEAINGQEVSHPENIIQDGASPWLIQ